MGSSAEHKVRIEATASRARHWLAEVQKVVEDRGTVDRERVADLAGYIRAAVERRRLLAWAGVTVDGRETSCWDATLGTPGDGVTFTLAYRETCYRRGRWLLQVRVHDGERHIDWGCFDAADQPERNYHDLQNAIAESEAIAAVLLADRMERGPVVGWVPPGTKEGSD